MPEVASLFNGVQIGPETTPGTGVAAGKLLGYLGFDPGPEIDFNSFRPMGQVVSSVITPGKDMTGIDLAGAGSYSEWIYLFCSLLKDVTPTTVDTTAKRWTFTPAGRSEDTPRTFTVEAGSATRAQKATYVLINGAEITFNREGGVSMSGSAVGQNIQDNITLTASPTAVEEAIILPTHLDVFYDTTAGGIGVTKLTRDFEAVFRCQDRWGMIWPINSANPSYVSHVHLQPTVQIELTVEADSQGMGVLPDARAGVTRYIRMSAVSTVN